MAYNIMAGGKKETFLSILSSKGKCLIVDVLEQKKPMKNNLTNFGWMYSLKTKDTQYYCTVSL